MKYRIICGSDHTDLEEKVNKALDEGYSVFGNLTYTGNFYQTMIKNFAHERS